MARWPARRLRGPGPLLADAALALVLMALSVTTVSTGGGNPVRPEAGTVIEVGPIPRGLAAGDRFDVVISVVQHQNPLTPFRSLEPRLTIRNASTGESTSYRAKPTRDVGVYRVRAVFPGAGVYSYEVGVGAFERTVSGGRAAAASSSSRGKVHAAASGSDSFPVWPVALTLLATLPVALRRRRPLAVLALTLAAALASDAFYGSFQFAGALVALYTVASHVGRPASVLAAAGTAAALPIVNLSPGGLGPLEVAGIYAVFGAAWLLGDNVRTRRAYLRVLEVRAARLEREREANARRAAAEEQARIARELHDIIAHNVSVMTVQAAAAGDVFETQPDRVREALGSIEWTGREALTELRRLFGSARVDDGAFAPQPGLARLEALVERVRGAGLTVDVTIEGSPQELPPSVDLSAYRIVQEALTNTLKHAHASNARVQVRHENGAVEVEVVDDGRGAAAGGDAERGHGIIGMRERAALFGGELEAGPAPGGGFAVRARIPLEEPGA
jgi:signal transduction histidine kinase